MLRSKLIALLLLGASAAACQAASFGKYYGTVQTEWIETDRKMRLLAPFSYVDPKGIEWKAPAGSVIDGASIPVFAWSIIGGPYNGKYRDASVIHDVACDQKTQPWEAVHEAFYWAMMASGVEPWRAKVMYAAVYHFGPRWPQLVTVSVPQNETAQASQQALARAEPGSAATIIRVRPQAAPGAGGPVQQVVDVQIQPPPRQLQEKDFTALKERIIQKEGGSVAAPPPPAAESVPAPRGRGFGGVGGSGGSDGQKFGYSAARRGGGGGSGSPVDLLDEGVSLSDIRSFKAQ